MKIDTSNIDKRQLMQTIDAAYSLSLATLTFAPKGEEAFTYIGQDYAGERYFIRLQQTAYAPELARVYAATNALLQRDALPFVVAPRLTKQQSGAATCAGCTTAWLAVVKRQPI